MKKIAAKARSVQKKGAVAQADYQSSLRNLGIWLAYSEVMSASVDFVSRFCFWFGCLVFDFRHACQGSLREVDALS